MSLRIKKGDKVVVISGKSRKKSGKVLRIFPEKNRAIVDGVNIVKKHIRKKTEAEAGGFQEVPLPLSISALQLFCSNCNKPARVKIEISKDKSKTRVCKKCHKAI